MVLKLLSAFLQDLYILGLLAFSFLPSPAQQVVLDHKLVINE